MREAASREAFRPLRESGGGAPFFFVSRSPRVEEREWIWAIPYPHSATRHFGGIHVVETTRLAISRLGSHAAGKTGWRNVATRAGGGGILHARNRMKNGRS